MDNSKVSALVKAIRRKTKTVINDHKNSNLILDVLKTSQSRYDPVICASCRALGDIFAHFVATNQLLDTGKISVAEEDLSKEDQFSSWLKEQLTTACDVLTDYLCHPTLDVQISALEAMIAMLQAEGKYSMKGVCGKLMEKIVTQLLSCEKDQKAMVEMLPNVLLAWEESAELTSLCLTSVRQALKQVDQPPSAVFLINCWRVIQQVVAQPLEDKSRKMLTGVVCDFLKHKMPLSLYREILIGISPVMEKMSTPLRLADFLSESFDIGGAISLMSLQGLFVLMSKYNLDFPDFYKKLYSMFEPQIFSAKYRSRFFHLSDMFLSSTHLPAYLIAAFAKRMARMCLHAPVSGASIAVPFILNLISRHPACEVLLHRSDSVTELDNDPFLADEKDMAQCQAMDSCLWELQTLEHHYNPNLSQVAKKRHMVEHDLSSVLETTTTDIITSEAKKIKEDVPVTFTRPSGIEMPQGFLL